MTQPIAPPASETLSPDATTPVTITIGDSSPGEPFSEEAMVLADSIVKPPLGDMPDDGANTVAVDAPSKSRRRAPYRDVYDAGRAIYVTREGWTLLHQHNASLRLVAKTFLADLYDVCAKELS